MLRLPVQQVAIDQTAKSLIQWLCGAVGCGRLGAFCTMDWPEYESTTSDPIGMYQSNDGLTADDNDYQPQLAIYA